MRIAGYVTLTLLSLAIAGYAIVVYGFLPLGAALPPDMRTTFEAHRIGIYTHIFAAVFALALGPFQFSTKLRARNLKLHRWFGRLYLGLGVLVGGVTGLFMAAHAFGGLAARLGFACLARGWLFTGLRAYTAIRAGDIASHRRLDVPQLRVHVCSRDAAAMGTGGNGFRHHVRSRLPRNCMALLDTESFRRRTSTQAQSSHSGLNSAILDLTD